MSLLSRQLAPTAFQSELRLQHALLAISEGKRRHARPSHAVQARVERQALDLLAKYGVRPPPRPSGGDGTPTAAVASATSVPAVPAVPAVDSGLVSSGSTGPGLPVASPPAVPGKRDGVWTLVDVQPGRLGTRKVTAGAVVPGSTRRQMTRSDHGGPGPRAGKQPPPAHSADGAGDVGRRAAQSGDVTGRGTAKESLPDTTPAAAPSSSGEVDRSAPAVATAPATRAATTAPQRFRDAVCECIAATLQRLHSERQGGGGGGGGDGSSTNVQRLPVALGTLARQVEQVFLFQAGVNPAAAVPLSDDHRAQLEALSTSALDRALS